MSSERSTRPILPGSRIGMLGGGQLGRMFVQAATQAGYRVTVLAPSRDEPAAQVAHDVIVAAYDDMGQVERMARSVDVVTTEFENVPAGSLEHASAFVPVRPSASVFAVALDREIEKATLTKLGLPVAPYAVIRSAEDLQPAIDSIGVRSILKSATAGYDGRGQRPIDEPSAIATAWRDIGATRAVLERRIDFVSEISVLGVRGIDGQVDAYEPVLNHHRDHVLDVTLCPVDLPQAVTAEARRITIAVLEGLDVVGVLCVEFFLCANGELLVNELAPRPHNSGHLTIEAHHCNQFQQQLRSVCGLPLGSTDRKVPAAAMANLMGDLWFDGTPRWDAAHGDSQVSLHLYGKTEARPGRKMGHMTVTGDDRNDLEQRIRRARESVSAKVPASAG